MKNWSSEMVVGISRPSNLESEEIFLDQVQDWEFSYKFKENPTKNQLKKLAILRHFLPKESSVVVKILLDENIKKYHLDEDVEFSFYNSEKVEALLYIEQRYRSTPEEFFGWLLQDCKKNQQTLLWENPDLIRILPTKFWKKKNLPLYPKRKRGYDDKGHLGSDFSKTLKQISSDFSIKDLVLKELRRKQNISDTFELLRGSII